MQIEDLCKLPSLTEEKIVEILQERYNSSLIYTYSGIVLLSVNPLKEIDIYNKNIMLLYSGRGVSDKGYVLEGVSNMDNGLEGVSFDNFMPEGVCNSIYNYKGVSNKDNGLEGVSNSIYNYKGVSNRDNELDGVNTCNSKQHLFTDLSNTYKQHPFINSTINTVSSFEPHIYSIAEHAYQDMLFTPHQTIVVSGESGSGKTVNTHYIIEYLINKENTSYRGVNREYNSYKGVSKNYSNYKGVNICTDYQQGVSSNETIALHPYTKISYLKYVTPLLESLGNATTTLNNNSSRYGKLITLYYHNNVNTYDIPILTPLYSSIKTYLLEKSRVTHQQPLERNFHIMYQVLNHRGLIIKNDYIDNTGSSDKRKDIHSYKGVTNKIDGQQGVNNSINEQQGVTNNIYEQQGVNNCIHEQHPGNNNIIEQHPLSNRINNITGDKVSTTYDDYTNTLYSLKVLEFPFIEELEDLLLCIIALGSIKFIEEDNTVLIANGSYFTKKSDSNTNTNTNLLTDPLQFIYNTLKITPSILQDYLLVKKINNKTEVITINNTVDTAKSLRDSLARTLYSMLFEYIVCYVNTKLAGNNKIDIYKGGNGNASRLEGVNNSIDKLPGVSNSTSEQHPFNITSVSILDIYGFEVFKNNTFDQFCINWANEKIQDEYVISLFKEKQALYQSEGIKWYSSVDNSCSTSSINTNTSINNTCIDLIESKYGIANLINEESINTVGSVNGLCNKIYKYNSNNKSLIKNKKENTVIVKHYACPVEYELKGFIEKNREKCCKGVISSINNRLIRVCRNNAEGVSDKGKNNVEGNSNKGKDNVEGNSDKGKDGAEGVGNTNSSYKGFTSNSYIKRPSTNTTAVAYFKNSIDILFKKIRGTHIHYIRCIKPGVTGFDSSYVIKQLKACGVLETIEMCKNTYPQDMYIEEFIERYGMLGGVNIEGEEGVTSSIDEQHPINNNTNKQHPINNNTNEQHPVANNTNNNMKSIINNIFLSLHDKTFLYKIGKTRIFFDYKLLGLLENKRLEYYKKHKIIVKGVILYIYLQGIKGYYNKLLLRIKGDIERKLNERSMDVYDISNRCYSNDTMENVRVLDNDIYDERVLNTDTKTCLNNTLNTKTYTDNKPTLDTLDFNILQNTHNNSTDSVNSTNNIKKATPFKDHLINNTSSIEINILKQKLKKYENFYKIPCKNCRALEVKYKAQTEALKDRNNLLMENEIIKKELSKLKKELNKMSIIVNNTHLNNSSVNNTHLNNSSVNNTHFDEERKNFLSKIQKLESELNRLKNTTDTPKIHFSNPYEIIGCLLEAFIQHCPSFTTDPFPKEEALSLAHTLYQSVLLLMHVRKDPSITELIGVIIDCVKDRISLISNDIYKVCFMLSNIIELKCIINTEILRHSKDSVNKVEGDSHISNSTSASITGVSTDSVTNTPFCSDGVIGEMEEVIELLFTCMVNYYRRVLMSYIPYSIVEYQGLKEFKCKEGFFNGWGGGGVSINKLIGVLDWMYGLLIFYCLPTNFCMEGVNYILKVINSISFNALLVHKGVLCLNRGIQINNNLNFIEKFCRDIEYSEGVLNMGHIKSVVKLINYVNAGAKLETIMDECSFLNVLQVKILFSKFKKEECCYEVKVADFSMEKFIREPKVYVPSVKEYSHHTFSVPRFLPSKYISSILGNI